MDQSSQATGVAIVVVPFPAQGHLNQLLHLSLHLSSRGLPLHFATSTTHSRQAKTRLQGWTSNSLENIHFHDFPLPPFQNSHPNPNLTNKFPTHLMPSFEAAMQLQAPLSSLLRSLSAASRRLVVVHDTLMAFTCSAADSLPNVETCRFTCISASYLLSFFPDELIKQFDQKLKQEVEVVVLSPLEGCYSEEFWDFATRHLLDLSSEAGIVMNTCQAIDGEFVNLLSSLPSFHQKKIFTIGPIHPINSRQYGDRCLEWLDKQPEASVVYVSFGSTTSICDEQIEQLAVGLKNSGQRFVWVLRDADRGDIFADGAEDRTKGLPLGFEEMVEGVGLVVRGWAPQLAILAHRSTGAFMSHCGWNSCMECLSFGVPMIAWPMHSDQPRNAVLVSEYLRVGVRMREWDRREEVVSSSEIERVIDRVMVSDEGREIRKRAQLLGEEVRGAAAVNGSSRDDLGSFVAHVTR